MADGTGKAVDFSYLEGFVAGDTAVVKEVLKLFRQSADEWTLRLMPDRPDWREVVHTIKGAGRGVGAVALGDACERAEEQGAQQLPQVRQALDEAVAAIDAYLARA